VHYLNGFAHDVLTSKGKKKAVGSGSIDDAGPRDRVRDVSFPIWQRSLPLFFRACLQHDRSPPVDRAHCGRTGMAFHFLVRFAAPSI